MTEIVFVLDRSGSMSGLEKDVIGGFNGYIQNQKAEEGEAYVTTVLFDHELNIIHNHMPIGEVPVLTTKEYFPRGMTALLDAVGNTIDLMSGKVSKDDKVIFMINTDGFENASREYTYPLVKKMIKNRPDWEFVFLGARIDAVSEASKLGIKEERAAQYFEAGDSVQVTYDALSAMTSNFRHDRKAKLAANWKDDITANYNKHTKKTKR